MIHGLPGGTGEQKAARLLTWRVLGGFCTLWREPVGVTRGCMLRWEPGGFPSVISDMAQLER